MTKKRNIENSGTTCTKKERMTKITITVNNNRGNSNNYKKNTYG